MSDAMTPPTLQQLFVVVFRSQYRHPWVVMHSRSQQYVTFCKTQKTAERLAADLNNKNKKCRRCGSDIGWGTPVWGKCLCEDDSE